MADTARLRGIYLNDHFTGATAGLELFRRAAGAQHGTAAGEVLARLTVEVEEDRETLLAIITRLGIAIRQYKVFAGWVAEKASRLKLNGHLLSRSPLSDLVELEGLRLGVEGKGAAWRTLLEWAADDTRLAAEELRLLVERADRQIAELEALRLQAAARLSGP